MKELIEGYKHFAATADKDFYSELTKGQKPHTLVISCSDSRIIPEEIFSAKPGEIFVLRNVGNLAKTDESSVQACIDYAVLHLGIKNILLGPTLPAFISPGVLDILVENYNIAPTTTPEEDLKKILG